MERQTVVDQLKTTISDGVKEGGKRYTVYTHFRKSRKLRETVKDDGVKKNKKKT